MHACSRSTHGVVGRIRLLKGVEASPSWRHCIKAKLARRTHTWFKVYYKTTIIKTVWCCYNYRHTDQKDKKPRMNSCTMWSNNSWRKVPKFLWGNDTLSKNVIGKLNISCQRMKLLAPYKKISSRDRQEGSVDIGTCWGSWHLSSISETHVNMKEN